MIFFDSQLIIVMHDVIWWSNSFVTLVYNMEFLLDFKFKLMLEHIPLLKTFFLQSWCDF
jgi:hypothetical protein